MNIRKKQILSLLLWRRYSATVDRINRNPLNKKFSIENRNVSTFTDRLKMWHFLCHEIIHDLPIDYFEFGVYMDNYSIPPVKTIQKILERILKCTFHKGDTGI